MRARARGRRAARRGRPRLRAARPRRGRARPRRGRAGRSARRAGAAAAAARAPTRGRRAGARRPRARRSSAPTGGAASDRGERRLDARPDLGRRRAEVLEPECDLVRDDREDDLILRILEDRCDRSRQLGRVARSACPVPRPRLGRRSGRRENAGRGPRAPAAASTCRSRTDRAAPRPRPARAPARAARASCVDPGYENSSSSSEARATAQLPRRAGGASTSATRSTSLQPGRGARVEPEPAEAARLHRLRDPGGALERAGDERREQRRVAARALEPEPTPAHRLDQPGSVALEGRDEPRRQRDRERRAAGESGRRHEPVVVEQERVGGERERERRQAQRVQSRLVELDRRDVERTEHRNRRPLPEHRSLRARPEKRREDEHAEPGRERAEEVDAPPLRRRPETDREQDRGDCGDCPELLGEERGEAGGGEEGRGGTGTQRGALTEPRIDARSERASRRRRSERDRLPTRRGAPPSCAQARTHLEHVGAGRNGRAERRHGLGADRLPEPASAPGRRSVVTDDGAPVFPWYPCRNGSGNAPTTTRASPSRSQAR